MQAKEAVRKFAEEADMGPGLRRDDKNAWDLNTTLNASEETSIPAHPAPSVSRVSTKCLTRDTSLHFSVRLDGPTLLAFALTGGRQRV